MVQNPYKVLGVVQGASKDEIKKAYRRKTKECHPDIHPDDPNAEAKMAEINAAYDMLMNPEKYRQQSEYQRGYSYGQGYSGGQSYSGGTYKEYGDFGGFDFGDIFGFGFGDGTQIPNPTIQRDDSINIRRVIESINSKQYQQAVNILNSIVSSSRNARWYYLSALANSGAGNTVMALEHIQRAVQMEPGNMEYQRLLQRFRQTSQNYRQYGQTYSMDSSAMQKLCMRLCMVNLFCSFCCR